MTAFSMGTPSCRSAIFLILSSSLEPMNSGLTEKVWLVETTNSALPLLLITWKRGSEKQCEESEQSEGKEISKLRANDGWYMNMILVELSTLFKGRLTPKSPGQLFFYSWSGLLPQNWQITSHNFDAFILCRLYPIASNKGWCVLMLPY